MANGPNKSRAMPVKNRMGTNTATMAKVDAKTGPAMAFAAALADSMEESPACMRRSMSSNITIALSTSSPKASAMPPKVMLLSPCPIACKAINAAITLMGTDITAIHAKRARPRNTNRTRATSTSPPKPAPTKPLIDRRTYELWSKMTLSCTSSGKRSFNFGSAARTASTASIVLLPDRLKMGRYT